ncbi:hypothetical protein FPQ18DRAFT_391537 [Pyronema domesticum]|nr:hypothetical protein FPQ18DRAFT_391537 [Pyronema domesticum]
MAKKGKKLTRKERKAAKEGENITKKPTDEAEKASKKSPDETEKPVETNDESENDKILHPVDIAHDARHFINEIAGSEKTLQEEYNTEVEFLKSENAKKNRDHSASGDTGQIFEEQIKELKDGFEPGIRAVQDANILKEPLEIAIPLLYDPDYNLFFTQQHLTTFKICIDAARGMASWEIEDQLGTKIYNCITEAMQAFIASCRENELEKMINEGHPIAYEIGLMKVFERVWNGIEPRPTSPEDPARFGSSQEPPSDCFEGQPWALRRNLVSKFVVEKRMEMQRANRDYYETLLSIEEEGVPLSIQRPE